MTSQPDELYALRLAIELCGYRHADAAYRAWERAGRPEPRAFFASAVAKVYPSSVSR